MSRLRLVRSFSNLKEFVGRLFVSDIVPSLIAPSLMWPILIFPNCSPLTDLERLRETKLNLPLMQPVDRRRWSCIQVLGNQKLRGVH